MESNSRSVTDVDDQPEVIHLKEISVDFIKKRPTSDLELVFKDDAGATRKSDKFKNGARVHWDVNIYLKSYTSATLTIQRLGGLFDLRVAKVALEFKPYKFGDDKVVRLEDSKHRVTVTFVYRKSKSPADVTRVLGSQATFTNTIAPMNTQQPRRRIPEVQFRVLIIGRANAGKTSILQRICETTESPVIYRGREEVTLDPSMDRGEHRIDDELVFSNHRGYIFHDSRGIESGSAGEVDILRKFIESKCGNGRLRDRLHAIWFDSRVFAITTTDGHILRYCVPMDNQRPQLDLKFFNDICPERNVPVIAVFTKFDQFRRNVQIYVEDFGSPDDDVLDVAEKRFQEHYVSPLGEDVRFVRLEQMHRQSLGCDKLIETTAAALNDDIVGLMLLAVQRGNLELSVKRALKRVFSHTGMDATGIVRECLIPFPYIWWFKLLRSDGFDDDGFDFDGFFDLGEDRRRSRERSSSRSSRLLDFRSLGEDRLLREFRSLLLELEFRSRGEDRREEELESRSLLLGRSFLRSVVELIMSFPTIQNLTPINLGGYHLISAVIVILKHATFLRLSNMSTESALTHAEVDYRKANIDSKIQQHLTAPSQENSDESLAGFIMAIDLSSVENTFA